MRVISLLLCLLFHITTSNAFKILGLFPLPIKSHFIFFEKFMKGLALKGHEVHVVSHFPQERSIPNYYDIDITGSVPKSIGRLSLRSNRNRGIFAKIKYTLRTAGSEICGDLFNHQSIKNLKESSMRFDLVVVETYGTDCMMPFGYHFDAPIVGISATDLLPWSGARMGNPESPAYIPNYFYTPGNNKIYEKLIIAVGFTALKLGYHFYSSVLADTKSKEFFGSHIPNLEQIVSNTSLLLVNSHFSINYPRAMVPGVIEVGGLHIEEPKSLSMELEKIVKSAENGVIYFSMGTVIDPQTIELLTLETLIEAFSKMPQTVIWSGISEGRTFPKNIIQFPWIEQLDLLCHKNLKAFVTHGGLMSLQESAYCAVPILGIPVYPDHQRHVNEYVKSGSGMSLDYENLTVENLTEALKELIGNRTYKENALILSQIFKERPISPIETAIYWTEYIAKHKGAPHLRSKSADLSWYEYYMVDLVVVVGIVSTIGALFAIAILYFLQKYFEGAFGFFTSKKEENQDDNKKDA